MKRILVGMFGAMLSLSAMAGPTAVRKQAEASMLLTGTILVGEQGQVTEHAIDQPNKVPKEVLDFVIKNVGKWQFEPFLMDGKPVSVRNRMNLRLVARTLDDGRYGAFIGGVNFYPYREAAKEAGSQVEARGDLMPPRYPMSAGQSGVSGDVYLIVRIAKDGSVTDVIAEQVNLRFIASELDMKNWRTVLAKSAKVTAKQWKFTPPTKGESAKQPFWTARVPVEFRFSDSNPPGYGEWEAYVAGPRQPVPWIEWNDLPGFTPDTLVSGDVQQVGGEGALRLRTPLQGT